MPDEQQHFEFFPVAIGRYKHLGALHVEPEVERIAALLAPFGAQSIPWETAQEWRGADAVADRLMQWSHPTRCADTFLYWLGHGWSNGSDAILAHALTAPTFESGVLPAQLALAIQRRGGHPTAAGSWAIVVIDACRSDRFVRLLIAEIARSLQTPPQILVIGVANEGAMSLGEFSRALCNVLGKNPSRAVDRITLWELARQLKKQLGDRAAVLLEVPDDAMLCRRVPALAGIPIDVADELQSVLDDLSDDERHHFVPKAQGGELGEPSWYFEGRDHERRHIAWWLRSSADGMLVITGPAGSGKSALLGDVIVRSNSRLNRILLAHRLMQPLDDERDGPPPYAFDAVIHLTGMSSAVLIDELCTAAGLAKPDPQASASAKVDHLLHHAASMRQRLTLLVDALDEAQQPLLIARQILRPMSNVPGIRIIIGTRASTHERPDHTVSGDRDLLEALGSTPGVELWLDADPGAVTRYVRRRLRDRLADKGGLAERISEVSWAIGAKARQFLYARLAAHEILARPELLDPAMISGLSELLAGDHRRLFATAAARLTELHPANGPLLAALSLARGRGLPILDGVWATAATALNGRMLITDDHINTLIDNAAPYLMVDREHGQTVYRLAHATFAEHYSYDSAPSHQAMAKALILAAADDPDEQLNPYLTAYLAEHASLAGSAGWLFLAQNPWVLDRLNPQSVAASALPSLFSGQQLPDEIIGIVGAQHILKNIRPRQRAGTRQFAMTRYTDKLIPSTPEQDAYSDWRVNQWEMYHHPLNIPLIEKADTNVLGWETCDLAAITEQDGRIVLAANFQDQTAKIWEVPPGTETCEPLTGVCGLTTLTDNTGHTRLVTGSEDGFITFREPRTGRPIREVRSGRICSLTTATGPAGHPLLIAGTWDRTVEIWDPSQDVRIAELETDHIDGVTLLSVATDAAGLTLLCTGCWAKNLEIWDLHTCQRINKIEASSLAEMFTTPDGQILLAAEIFSHSPPALGIWDPCTGIQLRTLEINSWADLTSLCKTTGSSDRTLLLTGHRDGAIKTYDPISGAQVREPLTAPSDSISAITTVTGPNEHRLTVSGSEDGTIRLWRPSPEIAAEYANYWPSPYYAVLLLTSSSQMDSIVVAQESWPPTLINEDGILELLANRNDIMPVHALAEFPGPDGRPLLATGNERGVLRIWDPRTGMMLRELVSEHKTKIRTIASLRQKSGRQLLATVKHQGPVEIWDPNGVVRTRELALAETSGIASFIGLDGRPLLAISKYGSKYSHTIEIWDPVRRTKRGELKSQTWGPLISFIDSDGKPRIATAREILSPNEIGQPPIQLGRATAGASALTVLGGSGTQTLLAAVVGDGTIQVWETKEGRPCATLHLGVEINGVSGHGHDLLVGTEEGWAHLTLFPRNWT